MRSGGVGVGRGGGDRRHEDGGQCVERRYRDFGQIAREILAEAAEIDRREDELYGSERGDELPQQLRTREGRRLALREAKERLARDREGASSDTPLEDEPPVTIELDPGQFVTRPQGRRAWVRGGHR